jgi:hypothetical protein
VNQPVESIRTKIHSLLDAQGEGPMRFKSSLQSAIVCLLMSAISAFAQGTGTSGSISGIVVDSTGAVVANAPVVAANDSKGIQYHAVTDGNGHYRFSGLAPAIYTVSAKSQGFAAETRKGITVMLGETATVDFRLQVSTVTNQVEVADTKAPVVDVERASQASTLDQQYINGLPIDRRDYLSFALLLPGVTQTLTIADDRDMRPLQIPQSGLSFYGSNGRGNSITVDGGNFTGSSQFVMFNVSQDAVQEFQINRADYSALLGGASGASINIVTKSGTNTFHSTIYGFFRNSALDARDPFAFGPALASGQPFSLTAQGLPVKNSLSRQQFGGAAGFPVRKDKTFLFVAYEGLLQDKQASVPLMTNSSILGPSSGQQPILGGLTALGSTPVPCLTGQPALAAATCAGILQNLLTINPVSSPMKQFLVNQIESSGGVLPFPLTTHQGSARLDHQFDDRNQGSLRYVAAHLVDSNPNALAVSTADNNFSDLQWTSSLQASWLHTFSANMLNEARVQWNINEYDITPNNMAEPNLALAGFGALGQAFTLPNISRERDYEFADNLTRVHGNHVIQVGGDEILRGKRSSSFGFMGGAFRFGDLPGGILSPCLQVPAACGLSAAPATINSLQSFGLGLPQLYIQGIGNPVVSTMMPWTGMHFQDTWSPRPNLHVQLGVRYEIDQRAYVNTSYHDVAPRISVAWDPFHDHKTVFRAGYGIYYAPIILQTDVSTANYNANSRLATLFAVPLTGLPGNPAANAGNIFRTLFTQGTITCGQPLPGNLGCVTPADLTQFGMNISNSGSLPPFSITFQAAPNLQNPYSQQASLGIEREITPDLSVSANYVYVHTVHLSRAIDANVLPGAPILSGVPGTNGLPFQDWKAPQCQVLVNNPCFANPLVAAHNVFYSSAGSLYQGGTLELKKRYSRHLTLMANYTYSKAMDDVPDITSWPSNQVQPQLERALSSFDQRHRIVVAGIIESPFRSRALARFELAPVMQYDSARPFNLYSATDVNGDRTDFGDRPPGAGRNTGIGPNYLSMDLRLSRRFKLREKTSLQLTAEAFNLANRTNYATVNDEVGASFSPPFNPHGSANLLPTQPLGFTSDFPKREIQLGARLSF